MRRTSLAFRFGSLVLLAVGLAALAFGFALAQDEDERGIVILLGEFYFQLEGQERNAPIVLEAGSSYRITFRNGGMMEHEVLIGRGLVRENGRPDGYEQNLLEDVELELTGDGWLVEVHGVLEFELQPGAEVVLVLTVPEALRGEWEIGCFLPGHYDSGMHAPFIID